MKKKLNLILFVLFSIFSLNINAHDFEMVNSDGKTIYYDITSSANLTVSVSYRGSSYSSYTNEYEGDIFIPSSVVYSGKTYSVTSIGRYAFYWCDGLTSITIPNSVTSIGDYAFYLCNSLTSVTIGNGVTSIGDYAFYSCKGLTSITIPNSITSIGSSAFCNCSGLTSINVDSDNPSYTSLNGVLFNKGKTELIICPKGKEGSYNIPNSVTSIGNNAFYSCKGLTSVTIPNSVTSIGYAAFYSCDGLTSITIPNSVTSIGNNAFSYCDALTSITIGNSVTSIGEDAFYGCSGLTSVTIPNSVTSIGDWAFSDCSGLTSVTIGNGVSSIGDRVFDLCYALTSINVDSDNPSYTSLNGVLFNKGKTQLIIYPKGKEGSYNIPNSVSSIENNAFSYCDALTSITIPNSVTSIGDKAFDNCKGLTSITIPNSVTSIGNYAFRNCDGLTSVTIGNGVTSIGNYAFSSCDALTSITIPNSVTSIGEDAFWGCRGLTSATIGDSVISIGDEAFSKCTGLTEIYSLSSDPAVCDANSFEGVDKTIPVYIPFGSKGAYKSAAEWEEFTNFIESEFTGVEENEIYASDIKVISGNGIEVNNYHGSIRIVNLAGQVVKDAYVNGYIQLSLPKGIYIVVTENYSQKVIL